MYLDIITLVVISFWDITSKIKLLLGHNSYVYGSLLVSIRTKISFCISQESTLYQHIKDSQEHDAVAWDAAPLNQQGLPHKPLDESVPESDGEEDMEDTSLEEVCPLLVLCLQPFMMNWCTSKMYTYTVIIWRRHVVE